MSHTIRQAPARLRRPADGNGPPVKLLLLHGMGGGPGSWDALSQSLAPHLELWDVSLPWAITGDPRWAQAHDVRQWVLAPIEQARPDVVVAHSFASNVVLELLADTDELTATPAVLVSPFYRNDPAELDWSTVIPGMERCYTRVAEEILRRRGSRVGDDTSEAITRRMLEFVGAHAPLRFYETCRRTPLLDLDTVSAPLFLVGGDRDEYGAYADDICALARRLPHAFLAIIGDCGHFPMAERPHELAALVNTFVDYAAQTALTAQELR